MRHSSTASLKKVWLRPPCNSAQQFYTRAGWPQIDLQQLREEFHRYHLLLEQFNVDVHLLPHAQNPDGIYLYDTLLHTKWGIIIYQSQKPNRRSEAVELQQLIDPQHVLGCIKAPAAIDGGDLFWLDDYTLAFGLSWRSNITGLKQLKLILKDYPVTIVAFDIPNLLGRDKCLHLMSLISPLREDLALTYSKALPIRLQKELDKRDIQSIPIHEEEFDSLASNVLALGNNKAIAVSGNPRTAERIHQAGIELFIFDGATLCLAGTGGPTCLTCIVERE